MSTIKFVASTYTKRKKNSVIQLDGQEILSTLESINIKCCNIPDTWYNMLLRKTDNENPILNTEKKRVWQWVIELQALSNGIYKSVWHRAIVNADFPRLSVASFLCPFDDALISPAKSLTGDEGSGAIYRDYTYAEYYKKFWSRNLDQEHCLELFKNH